MKYVKYDDFWWKWNDKESPLNKAQLSRPDYSDVCIDATELELVEVESFSELNWYGMKLYDNKYDTGWLDRSGKFYGCAYEYHTEQAEYIHKCTEEELEEKGFIKITKDIIENKLIGYFSGDSYNENMQPTKAQIKYLEELQNKKDCMIWFVYTSDELNDEMEPS